MSEITKLLKEKNEYLEKFYNLNSDEIVIMSEGNYDHLDDFYNSRDCILNLINSVEQKIDDMSRGLLTPEELSPSDKKNILVELDRKNDLVQRILAQDLQILSSIEKEKSKIIRELKQTQVVKKVFNSYQSEERKNTGKIDENV